MSNHFDTMVQRGPDNVDGSKYTSEVRFFHELLINTLYGIRAQSKVFF